MQVPISAEGPGALPVTLTETSTQLTLPPGTYTITTPDFLCGPRYTTWTQTRTVTVEAGQPVYVAVSYRVFASIMFGRVYYSNGWRIPLELSAKTAYFNEVQYRIQTPDGTGTYDLVPYDRWRRESGTYGDWVQITSLVPSQPNLEFRLVDVDGLGRITRIYYPPYTCGEDACEFQPYQLLWSP
jgi:hypothetical protein